MKDYLYDIAMRLGAFLSHHADRILARLGKHLAHGLLAGGVWLKAFFGGRQGRAATTGRRKRR